MVNMWYDKRKMKVIIWKEKEPTKFFYQMMIRKYLKKHLFLAQILSFLAVAS